VKRRAIAKKHHIIVMYTLKLKNGQEVGANILLFHIGNADRGVSLLRQLLLRSWRVGAATGRVTHLKNNNNNNNNNGQNNRVMLFWFIMVYTSFGGSNSPAEPPSPPTR